MEDPKRTSWKCIAYVYALLGSFLVQGLNWLRNGGGIVSSPPFPFPLSPPIPFPPLPYSLPFP